MSDAADTEDLPFAVEFDDKLRRQDDTRAPSDGTPIARTLRLLHDVLRQPRSAVDTGLTLGVGETTSEGFSSPPRPLGLPTRFRVQRLLGKGGFGTVYLATDDILSRDVAIKIPHQTEADNEERKLRFLRESRAVARLNHPNIVRVLDSGESLTATDDGRHLRLSWQVAEFVDGPHLNELRQEQGGHLPSAMAARIVSQLADAVHHAHEHGVLHRDIKPENVLLERVENENSLNATLDVWRPRLTDFGLARLSDSDIDVSRSGTLIGTPRYMAPEQLLGKTSLQGPCTDIYSLGVLLHELLIGVIPFPEANSLHSRIRMAEVQVPSFRSSQQGISRDLETICLKCLHVQPSDRYRTAGALRDDLNRFLDGRSTLARPLPFYEQVFRWGTQNRALAAAIVFSLFAILVAFAQALYSNRVSRQQNVTLTRTLDELTSAKEQSDRLRGLAENNRLQAVQNESRFRSLAWDSTIREALATLQRKRYFTTRSLLNSLQTSQPEKTQRIEWQLASCELGYHYSQIYSAPHSLHEICDVPGTDQLAIAGRSNRVDIVDRLTGRIVKSIETDVARIHAVAVSADGRQLAVGGTVGSDDLSRPVIYSLETGEQLQILGPQKTTIESLLFSADGTKLCCGSRYERVQIIDVETGAATELNTDRRNEWMAQSPDGTEIAVHARPKEVLICNLRNPQRSRAITMLFNVEYCEWIPGSSLLACTNYADESIILVNAYTGRIVADLHHSGMAITAVLASAEFRKVFIGRSDGTLVSWSVPEDVFASETRDEPNLSAGERRIEALMDDQTVHLEQDSEVELQHEAIISLLLKDNLLYAAGIDGSVCVYRFPKTPTGVFRNPLERSHWPAVTFLPVSGDVLIGDANGHISRIPRSDLKFSGRGLAQLHTPSDYSDFQVVDQGIRFVDRFAVTSDDSMVGLFDHLQQVRIDFPGDNKRASRIIVPQSQPLGEIDEVAISADKKWVAWTGASRTIQILRLDVEAPIRSVPLPSAGRALCFSPDSSMLACGGNFEKLVVYQTESLEPIAVLDGCEQCTTITWGADNVSLMLGFENGGVQRRSLHQDTPEKHSVHRMRVCSIALCERDQVAISTDRSGQIALWNSESGELYGLLFEPPMIPRGTGVTYSTVRLMENRELLHHFDSGRQDVLIRRWQTKEILPAEEIHAGPMDR